MVPPGVRGLVGAVVPGALPKVSAGRGDAAPAGPGGTCVPAAGLPVRPTVGAPSAAPVRPGDGVAGPVTRPAGAATPPTGEAGPTGWAFGTLREATRGL